jgi:hypothetical protein
VARSSTLLYGSRGAETSPLCRAWAVRGIVAAVRSQIRACHSPKERIVRTTLPAGARFPSDERFYTTKCTFGRSWLAIVPRLRRRGWAEADLGAVSARMSANDIAYSAACSGMLLLIANLCRHEKHSQCSPAVIGGMGDSGRRKHAVRCGLSVTHQPPGGLDTVFVQGGEGLSSCNRNVQLFVRSC